MPISNSIRLAWLAAMFVLVSPNVSRAETTGEESSDPYIYIVSPEANTVYPDAPATVDVLLLTESVFSVELFVDDVSWGVDSGCGFDCGFYGVQLEEGMHVLRVVGDDRAIDSITVFVGEGPAEGDSEGDTTGDGDGDTTESGDGNGDGDGDGSTTVSAEGDTDEDDTSDGNDESGDGPGADPDIANRGCEVGSSSSPLGLLALPMLLLLPAIRRRRD